MAPTPSPRQARCLGFPERQRCGGSTSRVPQRSLTADRGLPGEGAECRWAADTVTLALCEGLDLQPRGDGV